MTFDPTTLPVPIAPALSTPPTQDEIVRWNAYCEAMRHREDVISVIAERESLQQWRADERAWRDGHDARCAAHNKQHMLAIERHFAPTLDEALRLWSQLDVALGRLATAMGAPPPAPEPPPSIPAPR